MRTPRSELALALVVTLHLAACSKQEKAQPSCRDCGEEVCVGGVEPRSGHGVFAQVRASHHTGSQRQ